ncbi:MAG TPA: glycosyl hydrolase, partial [Candidatus Sumerlaeota bacterium]|nr:glycosyl hydrolase [Candidatus Sumerlaeota bacterium]
MKAICFVIIAGVSAFFGTGGGWAGDTGTSGTKTGTFSGEVNRSVLSAPSGQSVPSVISLPSVQSVPSVPSPLFPQTKGTSSDSLVQGWENPPREARLRAYWWWLNGNATTEAITRDLEEMKAKGFGGALICDADGSNQDGNDRAPHGPTFFSPEWRELFKHTLREADRLGLEMSLNIQSGWNLGGPMVTPDDAAKKLTWSELRVTGPAKVEAALPVPPSRDGYYRDLFVVAYREKPAPAKKRRPIDQFEYKAMYKTLNFSAPDTTPLVQDSYAEPDEEDTNTRDVVDLTPELAPDGTLRWDAPEGEWEILRFGCTIGDHSRVSTSSEGWTGFALDVLDAGAFQRYWDAVVEPLIADAGPLAG